MHYIIHFCRFFGQKADKNAKRLFSDPTTCQLTTETVALRHGAGTERKTQTKQQTSTNQCDQIWLFPARLAIFGGLLAGKIWCWRETAKPLKLAIFEYGPNSLIFM